MKLSWYSYRYTILPWSPTGYLVSKFPFSQSHDQSLVSHFFTTINKLPPAAFPALW